MKFFNRNSKDLCYDYDSAYFNYQLLMNGITVAVTMSDVVLRTVNMLLIKNIGFRTLSQETREIMTFTFLSQFFNFAILFLVSHADLHFILPFLRPNNKGYTQIGLNWYINAAPMLIQSLIINLFTPQIDFGLSYFKKWVERRYDRGCCVRGTTSKRKIQSYVKLYSGPEYEIYFKYAFMLKFVYVAFLFGLGLPIVFPITLAAFINMYVTEKLVLAYWHKIPPNFDTKISKRA